VIGVALCVMLGASGTAAAGRAQARQQQAARAAGEEAPEWQAACHFVASAAACANALAKLMLAETRALPSSKSAPSAAQLESFRTEALRLCDELRDSEQKARAALERATAGARDHSVEAPSSSAQGLPQASTGGSSRTLKRRLLRKQRRAQQAAAGDGGDIEMAGTQPPSSSPASDSPLLANATPVLGAEEH